MDEQSAKELGASYGFVLELSTPLDEINGFAHVYRHSVSGARLLYLENADENKSFSISFKTPATDDTGVFHILEHSVLCGSKKYPVKEPFVTLLKSSMQTFLNAMTFPDKTVYPVASTNDRDLMNLASVYLDAVFHPNIYQNEHIFQQEGWHYEFDAEENGELVYNGVVFNEMKGALSDPDQVLYDALSSALFPDTTYKFESGGTPKSIPDLTYKGFLDTHKRHYTPENSYIVLYGDLDAHKFLKFIDDEYLTPISKSQEKIDVPKIGQQVPVIAEGIIEKMPTAPENSCTAFGFVVGNSLEREKNVAAAVLLDAIMGSNEAPLKRALLDADIADDFEGYMSSSLLQPFVMLSARSLRNGATAQMKKVIEETIASLSGAGGDAPTLDEELIEASLSRSEFSMREFDFGYPDGVMHAMSAMNGWLYDDSPQAAIAYIKYEDLFKSLREKLGTGYYPALLQEIFLDNNHRAQVELVPVEQDGPNEQKRKLAQIQSAMTPDEIKQVSDNADALHAAQMTPDLAENLSKLPYLTRSDIGAAPQESKTHKISREAYTLLRHDEPTHGISYFTQYYNLSSLDFDELSYVSVLSMLLGKLDTKNYSAAKLDVLVQARLGSLKFACEIFERDIDGSGNKFLPLPKFSVISSSLDTKISEAVELVEEILTSTDFSDKKRILDILIQRKVIMEQNFANAGNSIASMRAASYFNKSSLLREQIEGVDFYVFLKRLIKKIESGEIDISETLSKLIKRIIESDGAILSFGGSDQAQSVVEKAICARDESKDSSCKPSNQNGASELIGSCDTTTSTLMDTCPEPFNRHEAFVVPTNVSYSALVGSRANVTSQPATFSGEWLVLSRILSYDYLWNEVRVVGGAYGVGFAMGRTGVAAFSSYRDPHISETFERFRLSDGWILQFNPSEEEFEGYVVSTAAAFDRPQKPRTLIRRQDSMILSGYTREKYLAYRQEVIDANLNGVKKLSHSLSEICSGACACVVGSRELIKDADVGLNMVSLLELE